MENATKALLIAAEVLVGIILITLAVYIISGFSTLSNSYDSRISVREVEQFNNKITKLIKNDLGYDYVTPQDVVTIFKIKAEEVEKVDITITGVTVGHEEEFLNNNLPEPNPSGDKMQEKIYIIEILSYDSQGRINGIRLTQDINERDII